MVLKDVILDVKTVYKNLVVWMLKKHTIKKVKEILETKKAEFVANLKAAELLKEEWEKLSEVEA